jgi:hypothetical protein
MVGNMENEQYESLYKNDQNSVEVSVGVAIVNK